MAGSHGVELRRLRIAQEPGRADAALLIVRVDPAQIQLRVKYAPDRPRSLRAWFDEDRPLLAINGSFFDEHYHSTALVISDGVSSGASYEGFGGMFAVSADGHVSIQPLRDQPYNPGEPLDQALQSFPMLVFPGGQPADIEDDQRARRTALALDRSGRLLFVVSPSNSFTLRELATWLSTSDLDIDRALNLDGGSSTGLYLQAGDVSEQIDPLGLLPLVLLVEPK